MLAWRWSAENTIDGADHAMNLHKVKAGLDLPAKLIPGLTRTLDFIPLAVLNISI